MTEAFCSRFVRASDMRRDHFVYPLPSSWWSRSYEYAWAAGFAEADDIALDAASGIEHPLKFYLVDHCRRCYACDADHRITDPGAIKAALLAMTGSRQLDSSPERYLQEVDYCRARLEELPYSDRKFDKIYCISVLEHLPDRFNRHAWLRPWRGLLPFAAGQVELALREFYRTLKDDGLLVLTLDYPRIDLGYFVSLVEEIGFAFSAGIDLELPEDALYSPAHRLYCFRSLLRKKKAVEGGTK